MNSNDYAAYRPVSLVTESFGKRVERMNDTYLQPHYVPNDLEQDYGWCNLQITYLKKFKSVLQEELDEIDELIHNAPNMRPLHLLTEMADLLADLTVYCRSEAVKYYIPLEQVLDIVMDSNFSKLDSDGKPILDERNKFLKGPNYWKPEPKIEALLRRHRVIVEDLRRVKVGTL